MTGPNYIVPDPYATRLEADIDRVTRTKEQPRAKKARRKVAKKHRRLRHIKGKVGKDRMFSLELDFSAVTIDSQQPSWSNPFDMAPNHSYWVRCQITQHQVDPLMQGIKLQWKKPGSNWTWKDGLGTYTTEELISNPTVVIRRIASGSVMARTTFRVVVADRYPRPI